MKPRTTPTDSGQWPEARLRDVARINPEPYSQSENRPFINYLDTGSITENRIDGLQRLVPGIDTIPSRARRKVEAGDILYSTVRPDQRHFGTIKEVPEHFLASTGFAVIRGKKGVADTAFIYHFLAQDQVIDHLQAIAETSTSTYPSIRPSDLEELTILLPPLAEQQAIAKVMDRLEDRIELNQQMTRTLKEMAKATFSNRLTEKGQRTPVRKETERNPKEGSKQDPQEQKPTKNIFCAKPDEGQKETFRRLIAEMLKERFPDGLNFTDILVEPRVDQDGEKYLHSYILFQGDIKRLDPAKTLGMSTILWPHAREMGYEAIPIQSFVEKSEWEAENR